MSRRRSQVLALIALAVVFHAAAGDEPIYTKTSSLPPLRITYHQLQSVLDKSATLVASANASSSDSRISESSRLKHGDIQVEIRGHQIQQSGARLPPLATEFWYTATQYPRSNAPVATVSMTFYDHDRRLTVEGRSPEHVDAVFASLKSDFLQMSSPIGGSGFRSLTGYLLLMGCILVALFGSLNWLATRNQRLILPVLFAYLGIFLLLWLPFSEFLAGFSVSNFDPSFASRYAPELAVVGLALAVVAIPLSYLIPKWFAPNNPATPSSVTSTPNPALKGTRPKRRAP